MRFLTKSRLRDARSCQRLHDIKYLQGYRSIQEDGPLRFGTLVHSGLEQIWRGEQLALPDGADAFDLARAEPMLGGYEARWQHDRDKYDVIGVEMEFDCPLINPVTGMKSKSWRLAGKLDAMVRERETGRVLVVEHKTSSADISAGSAYRARLRMDTQVSIYYAGAQSLGYDVAGILYDVLGKPKIRPLDVNSKRSVPESAEEFQKRVILDIMEKPDRYYQRWEVSRLESEMSDAMVDIWQSAKQIREAERLGYSPRNPESCEKWGKLCSFFPVCSGEASLNDERLFVKLHVVNPELSGTAKEERQHAGTEAATAVNATTA